MFAFYIQRFITVLISSWEAFCSRGIEAPILEPKITSCHFKISSPRNNPQFLWNMVLCFMLLPPLPAETQLPWFTRLRSSLFTSIKLTNLWLIRIPFSFWIWRYYDWWKIHFTKSKEVGITSINKRKFSLFLDQFEFCFLLGYSTGTTIFLGFFHCHWVAGSSIHFQFPAHKTIIIIISITHVDSFENSFYFPLS